MGHIVGSILAGPVDPTGLLQCKRSNQITRWNVADNTMYMHIDIRTFRLSLLGFLRGLCPFSFLFFLLESEVFVVLPRSHLTKVWLPWTCCQVD
jgi:hypothetical protein